MTDDVDIADDVSLQEMLRVMDVARELRKERETVAREFSRKETRDALRDRMLGVTTITGEELTEAEIDAALESYYNDLHRFRPPPPGVATMFAHLWVRRGTALFLLVLLSCMSWAVWWMWPREIDPRSEVFEVQIVSGGGKPSGVDRYFTDERGTRQPAYYVIVRAVSSNGDVLPRKIRNAETGEIEYVKTWAERVPQSVYERLQADKQADGILDETLFAVKRAGETELEIVLKNADGESLTRGGQITKW